MPEGPIKVRACKSILITEGTPEVKIKNTCLIQLRLYFISLCFNALRRGKVSLIVFHGTIVDASWTSE